jgi:spermidine/putrescine transport system permease protein
MIVAVASSIIATVMGTTAATAIYGYKNKLLKSSIMTVTNIPMMNPEIVTGISMMLLFVFVGSLFGKTGTLGFGTLIIAHATFELPYVILNVLPKLRQTDPNLSEAAQDLGCTPLQAFFKVVLPAIMPGIISGLMMAFTLSVDDFIISYFVSGTGSQTLPIRIFSMTKRRVTPDMYALSTLIFLAILALLVISNLVSSHGDKKLSKKGGGKK